MKKNNVIKLLANKWHTGESSALFEVASSSQRISEDTLEKALWEVKQLKSGVADVDSKEELSVLEWSFLGLGNKKKEDSSTKRPLPVSTKSMANAASHKKLQDAVQKAREAVVEFAQQSTDRQGLDDAKQLLMMVDDLLGVLKTMPSMK